MATMQAIPTPALFPHSWSAKQSEHAASRRGVNAGKQFNDSRNRLEPAELCEHPRHSATCEANEADGVRTRNLRIDSPML